MPRQGILYPLITNHYYGRRRRHNLMTTMTMDPSLPQHTRCPITIVISLHYACQCLNETKIKTGESNSKGGLFEEMKTNLERKYGKKQIRKIDEQ